MTRLSRLHHINTKGKTKTRSTNSHHEQKQVGRKAERQHRLGRDKGPALSEHKQKNANAKSSATTIR